MLKRYLALILAACMLGGTAFAAYWIGGEEDPCFHRIEHCQGAQKRTRITEAEDPGWGYFGKIPCDICWQDTVQKEGVDAVRRGDTYILRVPDEWMRARQDACVMSAEGLNPSAPHMFYDSDAHEWLVMYLHGDDYVKFAEEVLAKGSAEARWFSPGVSVDGGMMMSARHIGGAWFLALRAPDGISGGVDLRFAAGSLKWETEGVKWGKCLLTMQESEQFQAKSMKLQTRQMKGVQPFVEGTHGDLEYAVYDTQDACVGVFRAHNYAHASCANVTMAIGNGDLYINDGMEGYMDGKDAVFVCALKPMEVNLLRESGQVELLVGCEFRCEL